MHGEAACIKISVLQGLHGNGVVLPCMMVYGGGSSSTIRGRQYYSISTPGGLGDSRVIWMGAQAKGRALFIFDFWLYAELVFHKALSRHIEVGQHRELDLRV
jgi:hypothetical protein